MSSAKPHLLHILNSAMQDWIPDRRQELIKQYRASGQFQSEEQIAYQLSLDITEEYYDKVCDMILNDPGLGRIEERLSDLLVFQALTGKIIGQVYEILYFEHL